MAKERGYQEKLNEINKELSNLKRPKSLSFLELSKTLSLFCFVYWPIASGLLIIIFGLLVLVIDFFQFSKMGSSNIANTLMPFNLFKISGVFWSNFFLSIIGILLFAGIYSIIISNKVKKFEKEYNELKVKQKNFTDKINLEKAEAYEKEKRAKAKIMKKEEEKRLQFEKMQISKGLVKYKNQWGKPDQVRKWKEMDIGINQNFMNMSHFQFEEFIAKLFRKMGYSAKVTQKTGDYGIDVIAEKNGKKVAIQCKQNQIGNNVGNVTVQNTLGSMWKIKAEKSIIITTSDFTTKAEEQAREAPVELWDGRYLKDMVRKYFIESNNEKIKELQEKLDKQSSKE